MRPIVTVALLVIACHHPSGGGGTPAHPDEHCAPITDAGDAGDPDHLGLEVCTATDAAAKTVVTVRRVGETEVRWTETADALASAYLVGRSHAFIVVIRQGTQDWVVNLEIAADGTVTEQERFPDSGD